MLLFGTVGLTALPGRAFAEADVRSVAGLPGWGRDDLAGWLQAWKRSCAKQPWGRSAPIDPQAWAEACRAAERQKTATPAWVERYFHVKHTEPAAFVTGYFEPVIDGAKRPDKRHQVPLYAKPKDSALAGQTRQAIDGGALAGRGLEVVWLADPVDAFFLHIQGSGRVRMADGSEMRVAYNGNNGHAYRAIGRDLVAIGAIDAKAISMQSIAAWLRAHPVDAARIMQKNPRYIYFRKVQGDGPLGAQGVALTAQRSLAVDAARIPYGLPVWLDVDHPDPAERGPLRGLTVAQDTGGAIRGAGRADLFWGAGPRAADLAGRMQSRGRLYVLWPRRAAR